MNVTLSLIRSYQNGSVTADPAVARKIVTLLTALPQIDPQQFEKVIGNSVQDLMMVIYLSNLTKTQLVIAEQLEAYVS